MEEESELVLKKCKNESREHKYGFSHTFCKNYIVFRHGPHRTEYDEIIKDCKEKSEINTFCISHNEVLTTGDLYCSDDVIIQDIQEFSSECLNRITHINSIVIYELSGSNMYTDYLTMFMSYTDNISNWKIHIHQLYPIIPFHNLPKTRGFRASFKKLELWVGGIMDWMVWGKYQTMLFYSEYSHPVRFDFSNIVSCIDTGSIIKESAISYIVKKLVPISKMIIEIIPPTFVFRDTGSWRLDAQEQEENFVPEHWKQQTQENLKTLKEDNERLNLLLCARKYETDNLFNEDYFPLDMFKVVIGLTEMKFCNLN